MSSDVEAGHERTPLLHQNRLSELQHQRDEETQSIISSAVTKEEQHLAGSTVGERLPYNDYTTIDWLHDLVLTYALLVLKHGDLTRYRSKTLTASVTSSLAAVSATRSFLSSKQALAGSLLFLLVL